jgi:surface polysaccharide O-acyltransferase-like enzyme
MVSVQEENEHLLWPDLIKILSIYAVILVHSAAPLLIQYQELGETLWWMGNLYDSAARWCIPLFIMLSGTFVIDKARKNPRLFLRQRFRRVFFPFLIWSGIYFLWRIHANQEDLRPASFFLMIFREPIYYHLWFLHVILGLYLFSPIIGIYLRNADNRNIYYFLLLWFLLGSILPTLESFFGFTAYLSAGPSDTLFKYLGYFVLGYFLRNIMIKPRDSFLFSFLFLLGFLVTAYGTYILTVLRNGGAFDERLYEYFTLNVLMMSISIYLLGKSFGNPSFLVNIESRIGLVRGVASCVPGIYLVHAMVLAIFKRGMLGFTFSETTFHPAMGIPLFALGIFAASFLIVFLLKRLPGLKYIVP